MHKQGLLFREAMAALAPPKRFQLMLLLLGRADRSVSQLAALVRLSQSCTTRHLQALARAGLVRRVRDGKRVLFQPAPRDEAARSMLASLGKDGPAPVSGGTAAARGRSHPQAAGPPRAQPRESPGRSLPAGRAPRESRPLARDHVTGPTAASRRGRAPVPERPVAASRTDRARPSASPPRGPRRRAVGREATTGLEPVDSRAEAESGNSSAPVPEQAPAAEPARAREPAPTAEPARAPEPAWRRSDLEDYLL